MTIVNAVAGLTKAERRRRWSALLVLAAAFAASFLLNPLAPLGAGKWCGFLRLTGLPCPTCGMTRAVCCISQGMFEQALCFNCLGYAVYGGALLSVGVMATELVLGRKFKWYRPPRTWLAVGACVAALLMVWIFKVIETTGNNPEWVRQSLLYQAFQ